MKKYTFVSLVLATLSMAACVKDETPTLAPMSLVQDSEMVTFNVSVSEANTRGIITSGETKIKSVQIYVFDALEGFIEAYCNETTSTVVVSCTTGEKEIVALVNANEISDVANKEELMARVSDLSENSTSAFVMFGSSVELITSYLPDVSINVSRLVARISIGKISKKFTLPLYQEGVTIIKRIFLENVVGDLSFQEAGHESGNYTPKVWYNKSEYKSDLPDLLSEEMDVVLKKEYTGTHYFYCYPNPNSIENATRLVVELLVNGKNFYYPITIPEIKSNRSYHISELTITRVGYLYPDKYVDVEPVRFQFEVSEWESGMEDIDAEI